MNNNKEKSIKKIESKEKFKITFINIVKNKWLISGTKTLILVFILVATFILITTGMQKLNLTPIDLTKEKVYTLSDASKEKVTVIEKQVNLYFIGYTEDDPTMTLAKQYNKENKNLNVEAIDITQRADIAQKYGIASNDSTTGIIVECGEKSKVLSSSDLYTYDYNTDESIDLTEGKLTSAILAVTTEDVPNVYFLSGYSEFSLYSNMLYLSAYLENEVMRIDTLDILVEGKVPEDCDTLVIMSPKKDFEDVVSKAIIEYINAGGNILWFNAAKGIEQNFPNVNTVLAAYGIDPFSIGYIQETDSSKTVLGGAYLIKPEIEYTEITSDIYSADGVMLKEATKINVKSDEILEDLKVQKTDLLMASETSYFRTDLSLTSNFKTESDEAGEFIVGAMFTKTVKDAVETTNEETGEVEEEIPSVKSELIVFGENFFISDGEVISNSRTPYISIYNNRDLVLNSMAYLTEREQDIKIRKTTEDLTYTVTEQEDKIIKTIIFLLPVIIIGTGLVVWQVRRRKK